MSTTEKFCLKWNDFHDNISTAFESMRQDIDFADVTLACEDGQSVQAHKVILAASSPFFQNLLKQDKHSHPLIYMRGTKSEDVVAIIDFMYHGEANICQENLESFLAIAEELKLKGLTEGTRFEQEQTNKIFDGDSKPKPEIKTETAIIDHSTNVYTTAKIQTEKSNDNSMAIFNKSADIQEIDLQIKTMMTLGHGKLQDGKNRHMCSVCGKEASWQNIKDHIEAKHIEGICLPCNFCEKTYRSRKSLRMHKSNNHK